MGWRFRRSVKLLPGFRLNIGKSGVTSVSVGGGGFRTTFGKRGVTRSVGIPGTGLSFTSRVPTTTIAPRTSAPAPTPTYYGPDPERFGFSPDAVGQLAGNFKWIVLVAGAFLILAGGGIAEGVALLGVLIFIAGFIIPSGPKLRAQALTRCRELAQQELRQRVEAFQTQAKAADSTPAVKAALTKQQELGLTNDEAGRQIVDTLKGWLELDELQHTALANGGTLPIVTGHEDATAPDTCYFFMDGVTYDKRGDNDPSGRLYLTNERVLFIASEGLTDAPWSKVISVDQQGYEVRIQRRDRQTPYSFWMPSVGAALRANWLAKNIIANMKATSPTASTGTPTRPRRRAGAEGRGLVAVVGESHYQETLKTLQRAFIAKLVPEPTNPYDPNAVAVCTEGDAKIGYLSRDVAKSYQEILAKQSAPVTCPATLVGGESDKSNLGVVLDFEQVRKLKE